MNTTNWQRYLRSRFRPARCESAVPEKNFNRGFPNPEEPTESTTMKDFLEQLADGEIREPPPDFNLRLHERLNRTLVVQQLIDFFLAQLPGARLISCVPH